MNFTLTQEAKLIVSEANLAERWDPASLAGWAGRARALPAVDEGD
jgi:hypothetical protein